ncbi:MAG TPA: hypothetical protein VMR88_10380 [Candidatus Polarisedimenticolaceae bacterium]|nr:hypothetical protein [Candidatus Polarisedimenticolaceae bacterium]
MATTNELQLYLLTAEGLIRCGWDGRSEHVEVLNSALAGEVLREVAQDPFDRNHLYAATITEIHVSEDGGAHWKWIPSGGIDFRDIWAMDVDPTRQNQIYVGTLPAAVYVSENGGRSFRELAGFRKLPEYGKWTFPPAPHTAHIRCFALDARFPDEIIVGIEEGGIARSRDRGENWEDISGPQSAMAYPEYNDPAGIKPYQMGQHEDGRVYRDVHWVLRHPRSVNRLYATTGIGTYRSDDDGKSWTKAEYGMGRAYAIPIAIHRDAPDRIFLGAAENGPTSWLGHRTVRAGPYNTIKFSPDTSEKLGGAKTGILRSDDAGETWRRLNNGLPQSYPHMTCGFALHSQDRNTVCVSYTDGSIYASNDAGDSWRKLDVNVPKLYGIRLITVA